MNVMDAAVQYNSSLTPNGRKWLNDRGITDGTIASYLLGEVVGPVEGHERFKGSISIPYLNPDKSVRSIRFRYYSGGIQKYDSLAGISTSLYNVANTAREKVWICEGEFDALILTQMGFPAVGVAGVNNFKPDWKYLFRHCEQVSIVFDGDEPGRKGAQRLASILGEQVEQLRLLYLPPGTDCTDVFLSNEEELRNLVQ